MEAKRLGIDGVKQGDLLATLKSFPDASLDIVIAFDVLEHFTKAEALFFADEVFRILRSGGKWIIHAPNGESLFGSRILYNDFSHECAYTRASMTQLLKAAYFSTVLCQEDAPVPHGFKSTIRWLCWKVIRGMLRLYLTVETGAGERANIFSQNFLSVATKG